MAAKISCDVAIIGAGDDKAWGRAGDDVIHGEGGNDYLDGEAGDDTVYGGAGNDSLFGGAGNDTYYVDSANDLVREAASQGTDTVILSGTGFTLGINVEHLISTNSVGAVLNVVAGVGRMRMDDVMRGVVPFMLAEFAVMFLMVLFPWLVTAPARFLYG